MAKARTHELPLQKSSGKEKPRTGQGVSSSPEALGHGLDPGLPGPAAGRSVGPQPCHLLFSFWPSGKLRPDGAGTGPRPTGLLPWPPHPDDLCQPWPRPHRQRSHALHRNRAHPHCPTAVASVGGGSVCRPLLCDRPHVWAHVCPASLLWGLCQGGSTSGGRERGCVRASSWVREPLPT